MFQRRQLLKALSEAGVEFVIVGGIAAIAHGAAHITEDIDICYLRSPENLTRLADALKPLNPQLRGAPPGLPFRLDAPTLRAGLNFTLATVFGDLDLLGEISGLGTYENVKAQSIEVTMDETPVSILNLDGLITSKHAAGRAKDLNVIPALKALRAMKTQSD